ncbi:uncharacterized protein LOC127242790 [Andrographis paniculata]|uniref:uncharacterized protein LOC127242790 n=1 Tax=Andrographis paniculata TaxID=175694 RepID=UPI0021E7B7B2|nr:uncharacterized protein LOC127242790 [Andrographis paniculata]
MVGVSTWFRYINNKVDYAASITRKAYIQGQIGDTQLLHSIWRTILQGRLTFLHCNKEEKLAPMCAALTGTLLVRKIPMPHPETVNVGDVVLLKDPVNSSNRLVRRLAAIEGYEMVSDDKNDEPFVLEKDQCWVLADNERLKPVEAYDSRTFGPVAMSSYIVGRVIYCLRSTVDHGPVENSPSSAKEDSPVLEVELDVDEIARNHKA